MSTKKACEIRSYKKGDKVQITKLTKTDIGRFVVGQILTIKELYYPQHNNKEALIFQEIPEYFMWSDQVEYPTKLARVLK